MFLGAVMAALEMLENITRRRTQVVSIESGATPLLKRSSKELVADAMSEIETVSVEDAKTLLGQDDVVFVDLRDPRELEREGKIPAAFHCPRGMLEFWVDPDSPYHKPIFVSGKRLLFYCGSGWRSSLSTKTVQDMGLTNVCHLGGGYTAWKKEGGEIEAVVPKPVSGSKAE
jgi:rhodanese-related sulfurtransferase